MKKTVQIALLVLMACSSQISDAKQNNTLLGSWELCEDPDGSPKDIMQFNADGSASVMRNDGRATPLTYVVQENTVNISITAKGKTIQIQMTLSADGKKLALYSEKSKHSSYYVKLGNPYKFGCTAQ